MTFPRAGRLRPLAVCLFCSLPLWSQAPAPQPSQQPPAPPPQQQKKNNPFEAVPQSTEPQQPAPGPPRLEAPKPAVENVGPNAVPSEDVIEEIQFRGARRVP